MFQVVQPSANPFRHGRHAEQVQTDVLMLNLYDADLSAVPVKNAASPAKLQWPAPEGGEYCSPRQQLHALGYEAVLIMISLQASVSIATPALGGSRWWRMAPSSGRSQQPIC